MKTIKDSIDELIKSNKLSELLLNNTDEALFFYTMEGKLIYVNPAFEKITGYTTEELFEKNFIPYVHPDDQEWTMKLYEGLYRGEFFNEAQYRIIKKDGSIRWSSSSWQIVYDSENRKIGLQGKQRDITHQKETEIFLREVTNSADLANRAKTNFLTNMSHEIRTPLTAIMGFSELLASMPDIEASKKLRFLQTIIDSGKHLTGLIDNILDLSKIEASEMELDISTFAMTKFFSSVLDPLRLQAENAGIKFNVIYQSEMPKDIISDSTRIGQVLYNLIGNAIKFTESGHINITINLRENNTVIVFTIEDTGRGIRSEDHPKLFKRFSQVTHSSSQKFGGTGLGLNLSKKIAQLLGGDLSLVRSELNKGSVFEFVFPLSQPESNSLSQLKKKNDELVYHHFDQLQGSLKCVKILIVEDGYENQTLFREIFKLAAAKIQIVDNGVSAVEEALKNQYDIILMDLHLPVMNGHDATFTLRAKGYLGPIVAVSANDLKEDKLRAIEVGCNEYHSKPISAVTLINIVNKWSRGQK